LPLARLDLTRQHDFSRDFNAAIRRLHFKINERAEVNGFKRNGKWLRSLRSRCGGD
jgi:hypothetical protein